MPFVKRKRRKRRKPKEAKGKVRFKILGIEISFTTVLAGKIVFMLIVSVFFLWHCFFHLRTPIEWTFPAFILAVAAFAITLNYGCDYTTELSPKLFHHHQIHA